MPAQTFKKFVTPLLITIALSQSVYGKEMCAPFEPRIGDYMSTELLTTAPLFTDSLALCPDISACKKVYGKEMEIWAAPSYDSLCDITIIDDRYTMRLSKGEQFYETLTWNIPGISLRYLNKIPYGMTFDNINMQHRGKGYVSGGGGLFHSTGTISQTTHSGKSIVIDSDHALTNVYCVETFLEETILFNNGDTAIHHGYDKTWYAPGYRYHVLKNSSSVITSLDGDTIDTIDIWQFISPENQEATIKDDPINEEIRQSFKESLRKNRQKAPEHDKNREASMHDNNINWNPATRQITISNTFGDSHMRSFIICDIFGRTFDFGDISAGEPVTVNAAAYPSSAYLIYVETDTTPIIKKIIL